MPKIKGVLILILTGYVALRNGREGLAAEHYGKPPEQPYGDV